MKILNLVVVALLLIVFSAKASTKNMYKQTVRGTVIDQDSKTPIIGANVIILGSEPFKGASTDLDGNFRLSDVPVGRITLQITYLGYEKKTIPNIVVGSGKETVLNIEILESIVKLDDITVKAQRRKQEALNEMATVSAKVFTVEETKRYAGTFNDPARMVSSFAGVIGDPSGNNDIVVRGNSPRGILWKLEGIEIPNPNHFAGEGASGGPINALNSAMLSNSDFFSGAFAPEYGNAFSGVFDMKLRSGNNEKREYSLSGGALGFDGTLEGPFKPGYGGSYLINYRYSSLALLDDLGLVNFFGVPKYQDLSFKFNFPTKKAGSFSLFGLGGLSGIAQKNFDENNEDYVLEDADFSSGLGVVGLSHTYALGDNSFVKNVVSVSGTHNGGVFSKRNDAGYLVEVFNDNYLNSNFKLSTCFNSKIDARNRIKAGVIYTGLQYNVFSEYDVQADGNFKTSVDAEGNSGMLQSYLNWKYRINDDLTLISGVHYLHFMYNNSNSIEPRLGMEYRLNNSNVFSFGLGMHSKVENLSVYNVQIRNENNEYYKPNTELDLAKSIHLVAGYKHQFTPNLHFNTEVYYQHLYNVAVENDTESPFVLNNYMSGYSERPLVNKGTGRNYGLELTLERFFANQFYFLATGSVYDSKFTALDNVEHNSRFNAKYASNFLIGKEFNIGNREKNRSISVNAKATFIGGPYYTPIDLDASIEAGEAVRDYSNYMKKQADNIFKADFAVSYRRDRKNTTHEFKIDIQNVTNNQAVVGEYYDNFDQIIEENTQWEIFPNVIYTIQF